MPSKLMVTNRSALLAKYGAAGFTNIETALQSLIHADAARGIATTLAYLDDPVRVVFVTTAKDAKQNKDAIDALWTGENWDYLTILGAPDVVPHQDLDDPGTHDDDRSVPSDLPYACSAPYSRTISDFLSPDRPVSRLPDRMGETDASDFVCVIDNATLSTPASRESFSTYLGITAKVWQGSTDLSLSNIFGPGSVARPSPMDGPFWNSTELGSMAHFINCHGTPGDPTFYGQSGSSYPEAHRASHFFSKIRAGTIVSAECCYGAEFYDAGALGLHPPIANTYLTSGCVAYMGSTNIAYGPPVGNGAADLICQYFLIELLSGESVAAAGLRSRLKYIASAGTMGPIPLKTIAQFLVVGDSSLYPVQPSEAKAFGFFDRGSSNWMLRRRELVRSASEIGESTRFSAEPKEAGLPQAPPELEGFDGSWEPVGTSIHAVRSSGSSQMKRFSLNLGLGAERQVVVETWRSNGTLPAFLVRERYIGGIQEEERVYISR